VTEEKEIDREKRGWGWSLSQISVIGILFFVAFLLIVSCGKKGPPRAPELAVPETIKDLKAEAGGGGIALTWSRPTRYLDGKSLDDLAGFVIFRKEITQACPECPAPYRQRVTLNGRGRKSE